MDKVMYSTSQSKADKRGHRGGLGVFSSQIGVFPSRGVSFSQIVFFGSRGVSGSQVLVFPVPGLVFFLPAFGIVFFGSHSWCFPFPEFSPPRSVCFQFLDWCFPCPAPVLVFLVPRFGCFQSWTMCSLPGSCVGVPFHVFVCQLSFEFLATIAHRWI